MSRLPACSSCGCDMQLVAGRWRCPWTSSDRLEDGTVMVPGPMGSLTGTTARAVVCGWPGGSRDAASPRRHSIGG